MLSTRSMYPLDGAYERMGRALGCLAQLEAIQKSHEADQVPVVTVHEAPEALKAADPERRFLAQIKFDGPPVPETFRTILGEVFGHFRAAADSLIRDLGLRFILDQRPRSAGLKLVWGPSPGIRCFRRANAYTHLRRYGWRRRPLDWQAPESAGGSSR